MTTITHPAVTHTVTTVVTPAWTETITDIAAWTETIEDSPAWTETLTSSEAYDETIEVTPAHWQRYTWTGGPVEGEPGFPSDGWQANVEGDPHGIGVEGAYDVSHGGSGNADWFYLERVPAVTKVVHHDAVTTLVEHAAVTRTVEHPAVTHTVEHEAVLTSSEVTDEVAWTEHVESGMPVCEYEDGTPGLEVPCIWPADEVGNGQGCSFVLDFYGDVPHYVTSIVDGTVYTDDAGCVIEQQALDLVDAMLTPAPVAEVSTATTLTSSEPVALAETGAEPVTGLLVAAALVVAGIATLITRRVAA
jgi:hypothetical protein